MFQPTAQVYRTITYQERMSYLVRTYHFNCLVMVSVQILSTCSIRSRNTLRAIMFSDSLQPELERKLDFWKDQAWVANLRS